MSDNSDEVLKEEKKSFKVKDFLPLKFVFSTIFILVTLMVLLVTKFIYESKLENYTYNIHSSMVSNILKNYEIIYNDKINNSFLIASLLSKNSDIIKSLLKNKSSLVDLTTVLEDIKIKQEYVDMSIELIDDGGYSFKRSWTYLAGDDLSKTDPYIKNLIQAPKKQTMLSTTKRGFTIINRIPIYNKGTFLGLLVTYTHLDDFADTFKQQGFNSVIVLNQEDSKKVYQNQSYSKKFIDNHYVVNSNASSYLLRLIEQNGIKNFYKSWDDTFSDIISNEHIVLKFDLKGIDGSQKAQMLIFKLFDEIEYRGMELIQKWYIIVAILLIFLIAFITYYLYSNMKFKDLSRVNTSLVITNEDLKEKTDLLDYNEKKIENLFNSQPNLMFMHNGTEITSANKRFMGFFNRFGNFDGFKEKHKCVSELFEKYEAPNYIWEQYIEDVYWIDYILANPKRLYKVVISYKDDKNDFAHHFIIKLNEMDYAGQVSERLVIIALVDITQDLKNYKSIEELNKKSEKVV